MAKGLTLLVPVNWAVFKNGISSQAAKCSKWGTIQPNSRTCLTKLQHLVPHWSTFTASIPPSRGAMAAMAPEWLRGPVLRGLIPLAKQCSHNCWPQPVGRVPGNDPWCGATWWVRWDRLLNLRTHLDDLDLRVDITTVLQSAISVMKNRGCVSKHMLVQCHPLMGNTYFI